MVGDRGEGPAPSLLFSFPSFSLSHTHTYTSSFLPCIMPLPSQQAEYIALEAGLGEEEYAQYHWDSEASESLCPFPTDTCCISKVKGDYTTESGLITWVCPLHVL